MGLGFRSAWVSVGRDYGGAGLCWAGAELDLTLSWVCVCVGAATLFGRD